MSAARELAGRFRDAVHAAPAPGEGETVVVAVSGGLDSTVLLHLLRFTVGLPTVGLVVAHVDHAMRPSSVADAAWVRGLCLAWDVPYRHTRLDPPPTSEAEARRGRYAFLRKIAAAEGTVWIATAHHADDQAETVLFRALRGTGIRGLAGIPRRSGRAWRPLLPFRRVEIETYAHEVGLRWRDDPSNQDVDIARNALRHRVLPALEAGPAPHARRALVQLAERAREDEEAWASLEPGLLEPLEVQRAEGRISMLRDALLRYHPAVGARLLRALARELGHPLSEAGTRAAVEFTSHGSSGRARRLSGTLTLGREFGRLVLAEVGAVGLDRRVLIQGAASGSGRLRVGGRPFTVTWGSEPVPARWSEVFSSEEIRFPVVVRGWAPGDRMRLAYGTKKLKKLFREARVPAGERRCRPVVADGSGVVLWVPGVARSGPVRPVSGEDVLRIAIIDADVD